MKIKLNSIIAVLGMTIFISLPSFARKITDLSLLHDANSGLQAKVKFEKSTAGDDHVLYVVWDFVDHGANLHDWPNANTVRVDPIDPNTTEVVLNLPQSAKGTDSFRAFFVKPARTGNFDNLISCIRSAGGAYIDTKHYCTTNCEVSIDFQIPGFSTYMTTVDYYTLFGATPNKNGFSLRAGHTKNKYTWSLARTMGKNDARFHSYEVDGTITQSARTRITVSAAEGWYNVYSSSAAIDKRGSYSYGDGTTQSKYSMHVFANYFVDSVTTITPSGLIYEFYIKEKDSYVRKMYPALKDNVAGLWDAVNDIFYPSSSGSAFLAEDVEGVPYENQSFDKIVTGVIVPRDEQISSSQVACVSARKVKDVSFGRRPDGSTRVHINLSSGASDDVDVLYLAWGDADYGENIEAWPNVKRVGALKPAETSKSFILNHELNGIQYYRAFLATAWHPQVPKVLEYIRSAGGAYVDTGYLCAPNTRVRLEFQIPGCTKGMVGDYFGVVSDGTEYGTRALKLSTGSLVYYYFNTDGNMGSVGWIGEIAWDAGAYRVTVTTLEKLLTVSYVNSAGNTVTKSKGPSAIQGVERASRPLYLFASCSKEKTPLNPMPWGNLFGASLEEDGAYKRRFYPSVNENGIAGLWDQVENKFYPSKGVNGFLATDSEGNDIPEAAFPVETVYTSSAAVKGKYRVGFSVIVR